MSAKDIVAKVSEHLRENHIEAALGCKEGSWTSPGEIWFEVEGERHILPFWAGGDKSQEQKFAQAVLEDILAAKAAKRTTEANGSPRN